MGLPQWLTRRSKDNKYDIVRDLQAEQFVLIATFDTQLQNYGMIQQAKNFEEVKNAFVMGFRDPKAQTSVTFLHAEKFEIHEIAIWQPKGGLLIKHERPVNHGRLDQFKP